MENFSQSTCLIDHLVVLSSLRDRDALVRRLTQALAETVGARSVEIFAQVQDDDRRFWLALTRLERDGVVQVLAEPLRIDMSVLDPIDSAPERRRCLDQLEMISATMQSPQSGYLTRFPGVLSAGSRPWGVVEIQSDQTPGRAELLAVTRLLNVYGNMLGMLDYSECDALTGLLNRKSFEDLFYKALPSSDANAHAPSGLELRSAYSTDSFWLAMVDIDFFKRVNDTYGHLIGDEVLLLVARLLKTAFRMHDRVYRFGGEEFVVVLRCAGHDCAVAAVERFRASMVNYVFPQVGQITVSVGITEIVAGDSPISACERADQAVYYAKNNGRNQVCSELDLVRLGLLKTDVNVGDIELF